MRRRDWREVSVVKGRSLAKDQPSQHPYRITHNCLSGHLDICGRPHICIGKKAHCIFKRRKSTPPAASCCLHHSPGCGYWNISNSLNSRGEGEELREESACSVSMRTWVWIPRGHTNPRSSLASQLARWRLQVQPTKRASV